MFNDFNSQFHQLQSPHKTENDNKVSTIDLSLINKLSNNPIKSTCLSPYSLKMVLIPLMYGLNKSSNIYTKLANFLHLPKNISEIKLSEIITCSYNNTIDMQNVEMFSTILINCMYQLNPQYEKLVTLFMNNIQTISPSDVVNTVNKLVNEHTKGKITDILKNGDIDPTLFVLAIMNVIYFKDQWKEHFSKSCTKSDAVFTTITCSKIQIPQMYKMFKTRNYLETDTFQMIELPFKSSCVFGAILPNTNTPTSTTTNSPLANINMNNLNQYISLMKLNCTTYNVNVRIPKFKQEIELNMIDYLKPYLPELFTDSGNFDRMIITKRKDLHVNQFIQKISFEIDECGAEGAVTTITTFTTFSLKYVSQSSDPIKHFNANRTFIYYVRNTVTNGLLFYGVFDG